MVTCQLGRCNRVGVGPRCWKGAPAVIRGDMPEPCLAIHNIANNFPVFASRINQLQRPNTGDNKLAIRLFGAREYSAGHEKLTDRKDLRTNVVPVMLEKQVCEADNSRNKKNKGKNN